MNGCVYTSVVDSQITNVVEKFLFHLFFPFAFWKRTNLIALDECNMKCWMLGEQAGKRLRVFDEKAAFWIVSVKQCV